MDGNDKDPVAEILAMLGKNAVLYNGAPVTAGNLTAFVTQIFGTLRSQSDDIGRLNITIDVLTERLAAKR